MAGTLEWPELWNGQSSGMDGNGFVQVFGVLLAELPGVVREK